MSLRTYVAAIAMLGLAVTGVGAAESGSIYVCADEPGMAARVQALLPEFEIIAGADASLGAEDAMLAFFGRPGGAAEACAAEVPGFLDVLNRITGEAGQGTLDDFPRDPEAKPVSDTIQMQRWDTESEDASRWYVDICFVPAEAPCPADDGPEVLRDFLLEIE